MQEQPKQPLAVIVGANISAFRRAKGWSQTEFAKMLGIGGDSLSRIERGIVAPRFNRLEKIARTLECSVAALFTTDENQEIRQILARPLLSDREVALLAEHIAKLMRQEPQASNSR